MKRFCCCAVPIVALCAMITIAMANDEAAAKKNAATAKMTLEMQTAIADVGSGGFDESVPIADINTAIITAANNANAIDLPASASTNVPTTVPGGSQTTAHNAVADAAVDIS